MPTPLESKKCSLCGKRKPLSAYLTSEKNNKQLYGNVCHKCLGIDARFLSLHVLHKKIQQLLGKFGSGGLFNKNNDDDNGGEGDGSWDPEDRGKSKEYRLNLDAEELSTEAKQHEKLAGEKKEAETKAQKKEDKQKKIKDEKTQKKQLDALDEKTEEEEEEEKLEQEAKDEKTSEQEKKQDKKKLASANQERLFSSYLQKKSNVQRSYRQNETNRQTNTADNTHSSQETPQTQKSQTTTATTNTQQQSSNTTQASNQPNANSTQATNTTTNQQNQHSRQQPQNATAFYKQNPSVADQFADLSNVTIRNTVPTSVSAGTVRLFQQANMEKGKAGATARQEARQEGKEATAKAEAEQLKKAMQLSMKSWK